MQRIELDSRPCFEAGVHLQFNTSRQQWIVQAPERVLMPDDIAVAILKRCDGHTTINEIGEALAREYGAPQSVVTKDTIELLQDLADRGLICDARG